MELVDTLDLVKLSALEETLGVEPIKAGELFASDSMTTPEQAPVIDWGSRREWTVGI